jgi:glycyl-tRNA synthetase
LPHYSKRTIDIEYSFPFGKGEIIGLSNRGDYDLKNHIEHSNENLFYLDHKTASKLIPHIIEPSIGVDRIFLAIICNSYREDVLNNDRKRI